MDTAFQYWGDFFIKKKTKPPLVSCFDNIPYIDENFYLPKPTHCLRKDGKSHQKPPSQSRISIDASLISSHEWERLCYPLSKMILASK